MATAKQIAANRRNAQKSTGPRTPEGKARVAQNARQHGFRAKVLRLQDRQEETSFEALHALLMENLQPEGEAEGAEVLVLARAVWEMRGLRLWELSLCRAHMDLADPWCAFSSPDIPWHLFFRYEAQIQGRFFQALKALVVLQTSRGETLEGEEAAAVSEEAQDEEKEVSVEDNQTKPIRAAVVYGPWQPQPRKIARLLSQLRTLQGEGPSPEAIPREVWETFCPSPLLPGEPEERYRRLRDAFTQTEPQTLVEAILQEWWMAAAWRQERLRGLEARVMSQSRETLDPVLFQRYFLLWERSENTFLAYMDALSLLDKEEMPPEEAARDPLEEPLEAPPPDTGPVEQGSAL